MGSKISKIPNEVLKEIFPKKLNRFLASERVYTQLKQMILAGKLKKRKRLLREEIAQNFNVSEMVVSKAFSQLKKDGLVIIKGGVGSFVAKVRKSGFKSAGTVKSGHIFPRAFG